MTRWSPSPARHGSRKDSYLTAAPARTCRPAPPNGPSTPPTPPPAPPCPLAWKKPVLVNAGPDAPPRPTGRRILAPSAPAVIGGDRPPARAALWAITDSLRRADNDFGLIDPTASYTYTATETNPTDDPLGSPGGPPRQLLPAGSAGHHTVPALPGAPAGPTPSSAPRLPAPPP